MSISRAACIVGLALVFVVAPVRAGTPATVCTITINSADEKEAMRRALPPGRFRFVELVEHGRSDWLASACREEVRCDVLVVSGHYDGGSVFFSDRLGSDEHLPVAELERAACSASCPALFSQLKEVYLFGCNSLNPEATQSTTDEITRQLVRTGRTPAEAARASAALAARHRDSARDRMRRIFRDVPVLYGFSSVAPLGPAAGSVLDRHFRTAGHGEFGQGRPSASLIAQFREHALVAARGLTDRDPDASYRTDVCRFMDERETPEELAAFVQQVLDRGPVESRWLLDHLESFARSIPAAPLGGPKLPAALDALRLDVAARDRWLDYARGVADPAVRARMVIVAAQLGWLEPAAKRTELARIFGERDEAGRLDAGDVDLACTLADTEGLGAEGPVLPPSASATATGQALRACLGDPQARPAVLAAVPTPDPGIRASVGAYLRHRPIWDGSEFRNALAAIAAAPGGDLQAPGLELLAVQPRLDPESVALLLDWFGASRSLRIQRAIATLLLKGDYRSFASESVARSLQEERLRSPDGRDVIDALIERLTAS
jgi:hypothetical protein